MSRYIDADALKDTHYNYATGELVSLAWADIDTAPTIDIVLCKECRWWIVTMDENNSDEDYLKCSMDKWPNADDFCSYGERKESER